MQNIHEMLQHPAYGLQVCVCGGGGGGGEGGRLGHRDHLQLGGRCFSSAFVIFSMM